MTAHGQPDVLPPGSSLSSKQHEWDKPRIAADIAMVNASLPEPTQRRLDEESVRVAVCLRLGGKLCYPHQCPVPNAAP